MHLKINEERSEVGTGARSGYISQMYGSGDPDPHQNVTDPQHWLKDLAVVNEAMKTVCMEERIRNFKVGMVVKFLSKIYNFDSATEKSGRKFIISIPPKNF